jgi:hypothetical protein
VNFESDQHRGLGFRVWGVNISIEVNLQAGLSFPGKPAP